MQIEQMSATFGRLNGSQLDLQPGLNVICIIVRFVFGVVFLVHLNRTRKAYECPPANF